MTSIELQPLGDAEPDVLVSLCRALQETFRVPVKVRVASMEIGRFFDDRRNQYNSTEILHHISGTSSRPPDANLQLHDGISIMGITRSDLFIPILTYVFGEAALGGSVAVVSYHRFRNELYGLPVDRALMLERLRKVAIHEIGHTLGLVHCALQYCVMHSASYVEELDLKGHQFCPFCLSLVVKHLPAGL